MTYVYVRNQVCLYVGMYLYVHEKQSGESPITEISVTQVKVSENVPINIR
jgi:hypothetical protein